MNKKTIISTFVAILVAFVTTFVTAFFEEPIIENYGASSIKYCEAKDAYLIAIDYELFEVEKIDKGEWRTLHDGMLVFYLQLMGDDRIYFCSEPFVPEDWAKEVANRKLLIKGTIGVVCIILLFLIIFNVFGNRETNN